MKKCLTFLIVFPCIFFSFSQAIICPTGFDKVEIKIIPDNFPHETHWSLRNYYSGALLDTGNMIGDTLCVPQSGCYIFTIFDQAGDGICCNYGQGSYEVKYNGVVIKTGGSFTTKESTYLNCPAGVGCDNPLTAVKGTQTAPFRDAFYKFITDSAGIWQFSTCNLGNTCNTRLYIYDRCAGVNFTDGITGTMYYNDNSTACTSNGLQSIITAALQAGDTLLIRVGDSATNCTGTIHWSLHYLGPILGCMDSLACNYDPTATVSNGNCTYPPNPQCQAPDLLIVDSTIHQSIYLDSLAYLTGCYVPEGCLQGYGMRYILRFSTHIKNVGDKDYYVGVPSPNNPKFIWDPCHSHWHYIGYAEYIVFNHLNQQMQVGYKNGFCVLDLECSGGGTPKFGCNNMGITAGCGDIYDSNLSCQWVDITNLDTGQYTLVVRINWDKSPDVLGNYEKRYDNNWAQLCFRIDRNAQNKRVFTKVSTCPLFTDCAGDTMGSKQLDCKNNCGGSAKMGDLNNDSLANNTDIDLYLSELVNETLPYSKCADLNGDSSLTVTDAHRLNECLRFQAGTLLHPSPSQHHCQLPRNIVNLYDTISLSIGNKNFALKYFDIQVRNPRSKLLGYEFKLKGAVVNSVQNLVPSFLNDLRYNPNGHIIGLARNENSLPKNLNHTAFLRVFYDTLTDSNICIAQIHALVNEYYEECIKRRVNNCFAHPIDTLNLYDTLLINVHQTNHDSIIIRTRTVHTITYIGTTTTTTTDTIKTTTVLTQTDSSYRITQGNRDWTFFKRHWVVLTNFNLTTTSTTIRDSVVHYDTVYAHTSDTIFCNVTQENHDTLHIKTTLHYIHYGQQDTLIVHHDSTLTRTVRYQYFMLGFKSSSLPYHPLVLRDTLQKCDTFVHPITIVLRETITIYDTLTSGLADIPVADGLWLNPNPTSGRLEARMLTNARISDWHMYNALGQMVRKQEQATNTFKITLDITNEPDGMYMLKVLAGKHWVSRRVILLR